MKAEITASDKPVAISPTRNAEQQAAFQPPVIARPAAELFPIRAEMQQLATSMTCVSAAGRQFSSAWTELAGRRKRNRFFAKDWI